MKTYSTSEIADLIGIHPNTVRRYEELQLISRPARKPNGYRQFTDLHVGQFRVARLAFEVEVLQNGLRKHAVNIVKTTARCEFDRAMVLTVEYMRRIEAEKENAEEAIKITAELLCGADTEGPEICLNRSKTAEHLQITIDTLRNWELNGLLRVKRRRNGYRVYDNADIRRLKIIKSLRCANYSLAAILRMLNAISADPDTNIREAIDSARGEDDIITACDNLLTSLKNAAINGEKMYRCLERLKNENN